MRFSGKAPERGVLRPHSFGSQVPLRGAFLETRSFHFLPAERETPEGRQCPLRKGDLCSEPLLPLPFLKNNQVKTRGISRVTNSAPLYPQKALDASAPCLGRGLPLPWACIPVLMWVLGGGPCTPICSLAKLPSFLKETRASLLVSHVAKDLRPHPPIGLDWTEVQSPEVRLPAGEGGAPCPEPQGISREEGGHFLTDSLGGGGGKGAFEFQFLGASS